MLVKLEDVCEILDNKRVPITAQFRKSGIYPYYGANGLQDYIDDYIFDDELVLLAEDGGNFGSKDKPIAYRVSGKCWVNNHAHVLKPLEDKINVDYLCYSLMFYDVSNIVNGSTRKKLNQADMRNMLIPLKSMEEQHRIVSILDQVNDLISLRNQQLEQLDLLIKSRFVEMFGDPVTNPKCWEQKRFDQICENLDSRRKPITASERITGVYPYYGASGIIDYVSDYIFDEDILLISEDGANLLARTTPIAFSVSGKVWVNNHAHVVKFENLSLQKYIEIYFSFIDISTYITGSAQPKLNQAKLNAIMFPIPEGKLLDKFNLFFKQVDKTKATVKQSLEELGVLKNKLMQEYFG